MSSGRRALPLVLLALACAAGAGAQDFAAPAPPGEAGSAAALLERALPAARTRLAAEALAASWFAVPGLTTRALALGGGWRSLRAAAGLSQTGDPGLGWTAAALALGCAGPAAGGALRAIVRRDRDPDAMPSGGRGGLELGAGAWVEAGPGLTLSASAPQVATRGDAPPLERGFEIGATWVMDDLALRLARVSPRGGAGAAEHQADFALAAGALRVWLEARDQPARAGLGLGARAGPLSVAGTVESHPLLGETVRLSLALSHAARDRGP